MSVGSFTGGELIFPDGGGNFASAIADEDGVMNPAVAMAVFGGFAAEGVDESKRFGGGGGFLGGASG